MTEYRVEQIIQSCMRAFQTSMAQSMTEQITLAFTQLNRSTFANNGQSESQRDMRTNFGREDSEINSERNHT